MGNDFCTCLSDLTGTGSEDLSREGNTDNNIKKENKKPKVVLHKQSSIDSSDPLQSQKEKDSISTNMYSDYKNTLSNLQQKQKNSKEKQSILKKNLSNKKMSDKNINNKDSNIKNDKNINNNNNSNINNNARNKNIDKAELDKILNRELMVSENFKNFFNSSQGQEMILNMAEPKNKICITLHKYFVSLITRRKYKKNIKYFKEEGLQLFQKCLDIIYNSNPNLKKYENIKSIKYTPDGYLKYYTDLKDQEKMKYNPQKDSFDNCIIIFYNNNDSSSIDNVLWIYKGQVNKSGLPHGFGEKIYKNGIKEKGYWKEGEMYGWGMQIDSFGNIYVGPFFDKKGATGKGEKFTWKKKILYKGELLDGEKSGNGEEDSNEGTFVGKFYHDKKNGKGKMIYKLSGDIYEGDYKNGLFDGKGHYIWKNTGQEYTGDYKNGVMHGKGLLEWSGGEFYKGDFVNGKKEGEGELHMGNGRCYIGPFTNGRPNGIGIFDNGENFKGEMEFIDGKMNINYIKRKTTISSVSTVNINENSENKESLEVK